MNEIETPPRFTCTSIGLAAYLIVRQVPLMGLDRSDPGRVGFVFANAPVCRQLEQEFLGANGDVAPLLLLNAREHLLDLLHERRRGA